MRVIEARQYGDADVLELVERPEPVAQDGKVRVRVRAATVNPADVMTRSGALRGMTPHLRPPLVLGWDLAGTVLEDAAGFRAGQRVVGMVPWFDTGNGAYAEVVSVEPGWLAVLPDGVDVPVAATLPLNGLTARQALALFGDLAGRTLLVTGASGGVGGFAVQSAASAGAHVIAVASRGDEAHVAASGAKDVLARAEPAELVAAVRALVPGGVDAVLDAGVAGPSLIGAARDGGTFVAVIDPAAPQAERDVTVGVVHVEPDPEMLRSLVAALVDGNLTTRVAEVLPLAEAAQAHRRVAAGGLRGKVVLDV